MKSEGWRSILPERAAMRFFQALDVMRKIKFHPGTLQSQFRLLSRRA